MILVSEYPVLTGLSIDNNMDVQYQVTGCRTIIIIIINNNNDLEVAHPQNGSLSTRFLIKLEFGNVGF